MRRREFIAGLGGVVACPPGARAQQADRARRVGWLDILPETDPAALRRVQLFRGGLERLGWAVGRNLAIDYRWGAVDIDHARSDAAELLRLAPDVVICAGTPAALALQQLTRTVPVVFALVSEPVAQGIVQSLAHPGANITGFSYLEPTLGGKWLNLLKEIAPGINHVALMYNPASSPYSRLFYQSIREATAQLRVKAVLAEVHEPAEIEELMKVLAGEPGGGLIVSADAFNLANRELIIQLAARHELPAIYGFPGTAADGALIYYGGDVDDSYRQAVSYVDRILRGANPADLPVQQPTKFAMTINLKTANALGLTVPLTLHVAADALFE